MLNGSVFAGNVMKSVGIVATPTWLLKMPSTTFIRSSMACAADGPNRVGELEVADHRDLDLARRGRERGVGCSSQLADQRLKLRGRTRHSTARSPATAQVPSNKPPCVSDNR